MTLVLQRIPAVDAGDPIVGLQECGLLEALQRRLVAREFAQGVATVVECLGVVRAERNRAVVTRKCGFVVLEVVYRVAEIVMRGSDAAIDVDGPADEVARAVGIAELIGNQPQKMGGIEVPGLYSEHSFVESPGLRQLALLMQGECLLEIIVGPCDLGLMGRVPAFWNSSRRLVHRSSSSFLTARPY